MTNYGIPSNPAFKTTSWLRMWWLHAIRGYTVLEVRRRPRKGWFSRVTYDATYLMLPKQPD